jgi:8-oxo-dGTP pyrophosphatase MutT (NUDIX family)
LFWGWWLPGGFVECGDDHITTAAKETKEEAGIDINLVGLLGVQSSIKKHGGRQRAIFLAVPKDLEQPPKSVADEESKSAKWMTLDELKKLRALPPPIGLRGSELLEWAMYLEEGGPIYPLSTLAMSEHDAPKVPTKEEMKLMKEGIKALK